MELLQVVALALLQGLTEFLPISSSAHLILLPRLEDWSDKGLAFDVAVHVGTLTAVVAYFRKELQALARDWGRSVAARREVGESKLAWAVLLGTIPAGLAGLLFKDVVETSLRSP
ncbi:MAG TPA: undecaprenyl-diphosphate phosphatase, partial [Burkholderiales bacterium]|nr:undecaprenyl-diphosphate phosphatase [Burkholderiales bacterium]